MEEYHPLEQVVKLLKAENANYKQNFDKVHFVPLTKITFNFLGTANPFGTDNC